MLMEIELKGENEKGGGEGGTVCGKGGRELMGVEVF